MTTNLVKLSKIKPYENNPRKNKDAIEFLKKSIGEFGFQQPIIVDKNYIIICGHTRYFAAIEMGLTEVPVIVADNLTDEQVKAYRIADNKSHEHSGWDVDKLTIELQELLTLNCDLLTTGFNNDEITTLLKMDEFVPGDNDDEVPQVKELTDVTDGDMFALNKHMLICGDCTEVLVGPNLFIGGKFSPKISAIYTDPPYNIDFRPRSNVALGTTDHKDKSGSQRMDEAKIRSKGKNLKPRDPARKRMAKDEKLNNDNLDVVKYEEFTHKWLNASVNLLISGGRIYIFGGYSNFEDVVPILKSMANIHYVQPLVWVKLHPLLNMRDYLSNYELIFYGWKSGARHYFNKDTNPSDVISIKKAPTADRLHATQKPVELIAELMMHSSRIGDTVLDPFGGSGTTLIAAEKTRRHSIIIESDPRYVDVTLRRWEQFTGEKSRWLKNYKTTKTSKT